MMKMITMIMILLLIILNYNYSYILKLNRIINNNSNTKKYLLIKPNINDNHDEVVNIYNDYLLKDKSKAIHKVIDVPKLEDITKSIKKTKRTPQSKDFCIRSGGYPNNDIKYDMYKYITANALCNHDIQKINAKEKVKLKENRCIELKMVRESMMTFGIL